jgi:hypothetical protein
MEFYLPVSEYFSGASLIYNAEFDSPAEFTLTAETKSKIHVVPPELDLAGFNASFYHNDVFAGDNWVAVLGDTTIMLFVYTSSNDLIFYDTIDTEDR